MLCVIMLDVITTIDIVICVIMTDVMTLSAIWSNVKFLSDIKLIVLVPLSYSGLNVFSGALYCPGNIFMGLHYKTFYSRNLRIFGAFVPGKPLQPCLMFAGKAGAYLGEAPFRCSTLG